MEDSFIKYYLLVTANPLSDSSAALSIFKTIKQLDILSDEIDIFLPGFSVSDKAKKETEEEINATIAKIQDDNQLHNDDYHGKEPVYHTYIESCGDIYFNDVSFSRFMLDLESRSSKFGYYGRTDLVVLPTERGIILYDNLKSFNLELLNKQNHSKISVEEFIFTILKLIRKDTERNSLALIDKIDRLYQDSIQSQEEIRTSEIIMRLDHQILQYMKWKEQDEIFFISYSSKDEFNAFALKTLLERNGKNVWIAPDGIPTGFDYARAIPAALRITSRFVVLLSDNSANSDWVRREIGKAISNKTKVDGVFLDGFSYDDMHKYDHLDFMLENVQLKYSLQALFNNKDILQEFLTI